MFKKKQISIKRSMFVKKKKPKGFFAKKMDEARENIEFLNKINYNLTLRDIQIIMVVTCIAGLILGIVLNNMFISVAMMIIFPLSYLEYLNFMKNQVAIRIEKQIIKYSKIAISS